MFGIFFGIISSAIFYRSGLFQTGMKQIRICAAQTEISPQFAFNLASAQQCMQTASKRKADVICFPELFLTGPLRNNYDSVIVAHAKKMFGSWCKAYRIIGIMGSIIEKIKGRYYNISYLFDADGEIVGGYQKIHLTTNEAKYITAGNMLPVFKTGIGTVGIQICRDLLYPEVTKGLMCQGAQYVFCPSFWCARSESYGALYNETYFKNRIPAEVDILSSARAVENSIVFTFVNAAGTYPVIGKLPDRLLGKTQIALPFYGTVQKLGHTNAGLLFAEINPKILRDATKVYKIEKVINVPYAK